jgi:ribosomal protein L37AE/L43A
VASLPSAPSAALRMPPLEHPIMLPAAFLLTTIAASIVLVIGRDASLKRRLNPLLFGANIAIVGAIWLVAGRAAAGGFVVLLAVTAFVVTTRATRFCDACGFTIFPRGITRVRHCPRCKDDLRAQASARAAGIARDGRLMRSV